MVRCKMEHNYLRYSNHHCLSCKQLVWWFQSYLTKTRILYFSLYKHQSNCKDFSHLWWYLTNYWNGYQKQILISPKQPQSFIRLWKKSFSFLFFGTGRLLTDVFYKNTLRILFEYYFLLDYHNLLFSSVPEPLASTIMKCFRKCHFVFTFVVNKYIVWPWSFQGFK